jgi:GTP-binding protein
MLSAVGCKSGRDVRQDVARFSCSTLASMKIKSAVFDVSAPDLESCPKWALPEFAFIGRSNVGKSSLINLLSERRELAKVSVTPGKTKLINFFVINDRWSLVDLPGYGFAAVGKKERSEFNQAVGDYLEERKNIHCVFVLIDSRLPPQRIDLAFLEWLESCSVPFVLVFTKTDKQSATRAQANIAFFSQSLSAAGRRVPQIFSSSSKTGGGRTEILGFIEQSLAKSNRS